MNERIKQLAEQAGMNAIEPVMDFDRKETHWNGWASAMEKFAELIVRECVRVMYDNAIERNVPPDISQTPTHYAVAVLEHFGVE